MNFFELYEFTFQVVQKLDQSAAADSARLLLEEADTQWEIGEERIAEKVLKVALQQAHKAARSSVREQIVERLFNLI